MLFSRSGAFFALFLMIGLCAPWTARADEIPADSQIEKVTVYTGRATVTRTASVPVPAGSHVVVMSGLPAGLMPDSIRSEGVATAAVTLGAVESRVVSSSELAAPKERALQEKLDGLKDARALIVADQRAASDRLTFLKKMGDAAVTRANEDITKTLTMKPDEWVGASEKLSAAVRETLKTAEGYVVALRKMDAEIEAVQDEMDQLQTGATQSYQIKIPVESAGPTTLTLRAEYQIGGATWTPVYDARLDTGKSSVLLTQYADVTQATGEDWTNVKLTLSTAQPTQSAALPPITTYWINGYDPKENRGGGSAGFMAKQVARMEMHAMDAASTMGNAVAEMEAPAAAPAPMAATIQAAQIETGGYVARYHVPGLVSVTADRAARKVMIQDMKTDATLIAKIAPAIDPRAYVVARTTIKGDSPLLPGKINLFRDQAYIGSVYQGLLKAGDETDLSFGVDDQIDVKRVTLTDTRGEEGIVSKTNTLERLYETEVTNLHPFDVTAEVIEATPISQNEKIQVTLNQKETTPGFEDNLKKAKGVKRWTLPLPAKAKKSVKLGWSVTWPSGWMVNGI